MTKLAAASSVRGSSVSIAGIAAVACGDFGGGVCCGWGRAGAGRLRLPQSLLLVGVLGRGDHCGGAGVRRNLCCQCGTQPRDCGGGVFAAGGGGAGLAPERMGRSEQFVFLLLVEIIMELPCGK